MLYSDNIDINDNHIGSTDNDNSITDTKDDPGNNVIDNANNDGNDCSSDN